MKIQDILTQLRALDVSDAVHWRDEHVRFISQVSALLFLQPGPGSQLGSAQSSLRATSSSASIEEAGELALKLIPRLYGKPAYAVMFMPAPPDAGPDNLQAPAPLHSSTPLFLSSVLDAIASSVPNIASDAAALLPGLLDSLFTPFAPSPSPSRPRPRSPSLPTPRSAVSGGSSIASTAPLRPPSSPSPSSPQTPSSTHAPIHTTAPSAPPALPSAPQRTPSTVLLSATLPPVPTLAILPGLISATSAVLLPDMAPLPPADGSSGAEPRSARLRPKGLAAVARAFGRCVSAALAAGAAATTYHSVRELVARGAVGGPTGPDVCGACGLCRERGGANEGDSTIHARDSAPMTARVPAISSAPVTCRCRVCHTLRTAAIGAAMDAEALAVLLAPYADWWSANAAAVAAACARVFAAVGRAGYVGGSFGTASSESDWSRAVGAAASIGASGAISSESGLCSVCASSPCTSGCLDRSASSTSHGQTPDGATLAIAAVVATAVVVAASAVADASPPPPPPPPPISLCAPGHPLSDPAVVHELAAAAAAAGVAAVNVMADPPQHPHAGVGASLPEWPRGTSDARPLSSRPPLTLARVLAPVLLDAMTAATIAPPPPASLEGGPVRTFTPALVASVAAQMVRPCGLWCGNLRTHRAAAAVGPAAYAARLARWGALLPPHMVDGGAGVGPDWATTHSTGCPVGAATEYARALVERAHAGDAASAQVEARMGEHGELGAMAASIAGRASARCRRIAIAGATAASRLGTLTGGTPQQGSALHHQLGGLSADMRLAEDSRANHTTVADSCDARYSHGGFLWNAAAGRSASEALGRYVADMHTATEPTEPSGATATHAADTDPLSLAPPPAASDSSLGVPWDLVVVANTLRILAAPLPAGRGGSPSGTRAPTSAGPCGVADSPRLANLIATWGGAARSHVPAAMDGTSVVSEWGATAAYSAAPLPAITLSDVGVCDELDPFVAVAMRVSRDVVGRWTMALGAPLGEVPTLGGVSADADVADLTTTLAAIDADGLASDSVGGWAVESMRAAWRARNERDGLNGLSATTDGDSWWLGGWDGSDPGTDSEEDDARVGMNAVAAAAVAIPVEEHAKMLVADTIAAARMMETDITAAMVASRPAQARPGDTLGEPHEPLSADDQAALHAVLAAAAADAPMPRSETSEPRRRQRRLCGTCDASLPAAVALACRAGIHSSTVGLLVAQCAAAASVRAPRVWARGADGAYLETTAPVTGAPRGATVERMRMRVTLRGRPLVPPAAALPPARRAVFTSLQQSGSDYTRGLNANPAAIPCALQKLPRGTRRALLCAAVDALIGAIAAAPPVDNVPVASAAVALVTDALSAAATAAMGVLPSAAAGPHARMSACGAPRDAVQVSLATFPPASATASTLPDPTLAAATVSTQWSAITQVAAALVAAWRLEVVLPLMTERLREWPAWRTHVHVAVAARVCIRAMADATAYAATRAARASAVAAAASAAAVDQFVVALPDTSGGDSAALHATVSAATRAVRVATATAAAAATHAAGLAAGLSPAILGPLLTLLCAPPLYDVSDVAAAVGVLDLSPTAQARARAINARRAAPYDGDAGGADDSARGSRQRALPLTTTATTTTGCAPVTQAHMRSALLSVLPSCCAAVGGACVLHRLALVAATSGVIAAATDAAVVGVLTRRIADGASVGPGPASGTASTSWGETVALDWLAASGSAPRTHAATAVPLAFPDSGDAGVFVGVGGFVRDALMDSQGSSRVVHARTPALLVAGAAAGGVVGAVTGALVAGRADHHSADLDGTAVSAARVMIGMFLTGANPCRTAGGDVPPVVATPPAVAAIADVHIWSLMAHATSGLAGAGPAAAAALRYVLSVCGLLTCGSAVADAVASALYSASASRPSSRTPVPATPSDLAATGTTTCVAVGAFGDDIVSLPLQDVVARDIDNRAYTRATPTDHDDDELSAALAHREDTTVTVAHRGARGGMLDEHDAPPPPAALAVSAGASPALLVVMAATAAAAVDSVAPAAAAALSYVSALAPAADALSLYLSIVSRGVLADESAGDAGARGGMRLARGALTDATLRVAVAMTGVLDRILRGTRSGAGALPAVTARVVRLAGDAAALLCGHVRAMLWVCGGCWGGHAAPTALPAEGATLGPTSVSFNGLCQLHRTAAAEAVVASGITATRNDGLCNNSTQCVACVAVGAMLEVGKSRDALVRRGAAAAADAAAADANGAVGIASAPALRMAGYLHAFAASVTRGTRSGNIKLPLTPHPAPCAACPVTPGAPYCGDINVSGNRAAGGGGESGSAVGGGGPPARCGGCGRLCFLPGQHETLSPAHWAWSGLAEAATAGIVRAASVAQGADDAPGGLDAAAPAATPAHVPHIASFMAHASAAQLRAALADCGYAAHHCTAPKSWGAIWRAAAVGAAPVPVGATALATAAVTLTTGGEGEDSASTKFIGRVALRAPATAAAEAAFARTAPPVSAAAAIRGEGETATADEAADDRTAALPPAAVAAAEAILAVCERLHHIVGVAGVDASVGAAATVAATHPQRVVHGHAAGAHRGTAHVAMRQREVVATTALRTLAGLVGAFIRQAVVVWSPPVAVATLEQLVGLRFAAMSVTSLSATGGATAVSLDALLAVPPPVLLPGTMPCPPAELVDGFATVHTAALPLVYKLWTTALRVLRPPAASVAHGVRTAEANATGVPAAGTTVGMGGASVLRLSAGEAQKSVDAAIAPFSAAWGPWGSSGGWAGAAAEAAAARHGASDAVARDAATHVAPSLFGNGATRVPLGAMSSARRAATSTSSPLVVAAIDAVAALVFAQRDFVDARARAEAWPHVAYRCVYDADVVAVAGSGAFHATNGVGGKPRRRSGPPCGHAAAGRAANDTPNATADSVGNDDDAAARARARAAGHATAAVAAGSSSLAQRMFAAPTDVCHHKAASTDTTAGDAVGSSGDVFTAAFVHVTRSTFGSVNLGMRGAAYAPLLWMLRAARPHGSGCTIPLAAADPHRVPLLIPTRARWTARVRVTTRATIVAALRLAVLLTAPVYAHSMAPPAIGAASADAIGAFARSVVAMVERLGLHPQVYWGRRTQGATAAAPGDISHAAYLSNVTGSVHDAAVRLGVVSHCMPGGTRGATGSDANGPALADGDGGSTLHLSSLWFGDDPLDGAAAAAQLAWLLPLMGRRSALDVESLVSVMTAASNGSLSIWDGEADFIPPPTVVLRGGAVSPDAIGILAARVWAQGHYLAMFAKAMCVAPHDRIDQDPSPG